MRVKLVKVIFGPDFRKVAVECIKAATSSIEVMMYEWSWYRGQRSGTVQDVNRELCLAAERGVKVRVILHNESKGRHLGKLNRESAGHMERHKVKVLMQPQQRVLHAKVWVFDGKVALVGSHNISNRSVGSNIEASVMFEDQNEIQNILKEFELLWGRGIKAPQVGASESATKAAHRSRCISPGCETSSRLLPLARLLQ